MPPVQHPITHFILNVVISRAMHAVHSLEGSVCYLFNYVSVFSAFIVFSTFSNTLLYLIESKDTVDSCSKIQVEGAENLCYVS